MKRENPRRLRTRIPVRRPDCKEAPVDILLLERDKLVRDQILVGLQSFPEIAVEVGEGYVGLHRTRQKSYDFVIIGCNPKDDEGLRLLTSLREYDRDTQVVLVTSAKQVKSLLAQRSKFDLFAVLGVPVVPEDFFRILARMRRRMSA